MTTKQAASNATVLGRCSWQGTGWLICPRLALTIPGFLFLFPETQWPFSCFAFSVRWLLRQRTPSLLLQRGRALRLGQGCPEEPKAQTARIPSPQPGLPERLWGLSVASAQEGRSLGAQGAGLPRLASSRGFPLLEVGIAIIRSALRSPGGCPPLLLPIKRVFPAGTRNLSRHRQTQDPSPVPSGPQDPTLRSPWACPPPSQPHLPSVQPLRLSPFPTHPTLPHLCSPRRSR